MSPCRSQPAPLSQLAPLAPPGLERLVQACLAKDPAERYASMKELGGDLGAYLDGRVVRAYETGAVAEFPHSSVAVQVRITLYSCGQFPSVDRTSVV